VDEHVCPAAGLHVERAEEPLTPVAAALGDRDRHLVVGVDQKLGAFEADLVERVVRDEPQGTGGDSAPARPTDDHVADLGLVRLSLDGDEPGDAEELARLRVEDRVAVSRPVGGAGLVRLQPPLLEAFLGRVGKARVANDRGIQEEPGESVEMRP
jgi:hypothetical protein